MKYFRIYTGADGLSYFEDIEVDSSGPGVPETGSGIPVTDLVFRSSPPGRVTDYHTAPRRQFVITLRGEAEIVASGGETRRVGPGSMMLAEDTTGKGHITRVVGSEERQYLFVTLPD
jgi:quercetin dioxygenase-like cupin family protein